MTTPAFTCAVGTDVERITSGNCRALYGFVCIFHQEVGYITVVPAETDDMDMDDDMDDMTDMDMDGMDMDMIP